MKHEDPLLLDKEKIQAENNKLKQKVRELEAEINLLKQSNQLFEENAKLFHHGPVVVFKRRNTPERPVEYVSQNVEDILGYTREDFRKNDNFYAQIIHKDDLERVKGEVMENVEKKSEHFTHEPYRVTTSTGKDIRVYDYTTTHRDSKGNLTHFIGYIIDISKPCALFKEIMTN